MTGPWPVAARVGAARASDGLPANAPAVILLSRCAGSAVLQRHRPRLLAITSHDGVGTTNVARFIGIEGRVDSSIHNVGASLAGGSADLVAPECVACVDADADDVTRLDRVEVERLERFVDESRLSVQRRRRRREDIQPSRRDDANAKRDVAWIDKVDGHAADACRTITLER